MNVTIRMMVIFFLCPVAFSQIIDLNQPAEGIIKIMRGTDNIAGGGNVQNIGDFNGDGLNDFALSFPLSDKVYVIYGKRNYPAVLNLASLGPNGFSIQGNPGTAFGASFTSPGDINRDGKTDLVIGAPFDGIGGRVYVLKGSFLLQKIDVSQQERFLLIVEGTFGESIGTLLGKGGFIDNDSSADILIPSPFFSQSSEDSIQVLGAAYVIYGQIQFATQTLQTQSLDPASTLTVLNKPKFSADGTITNLNFGTQFQAVGDFTGDGSNDMALVTQRTTIDPGGIQIRIIAGGNRLTGIQFIDQLMADTVDIDIQLFSQARMHTLRSLQQCDVNQDGIPELILGFPLASLPGIDSATGVVAILSRSDMRDHTIRITYDQRQSTILLTSRNENSALGNAVACSPIRLLLGAPTANLVTGINPAGNQGGLFFVPTSRLSFSAIIDRVADVSSPVYYGKSTGDRFAHSIDILGDLNRDGFDEIIVGTQEIENQPVAAYILISPPAATGIHDFMMY